MVKEMRGEGRGVKDSSQGVKQRESVWEMEEERSRRGREEGGMTNRAKRGTDVE